MIGSYPVATFLVDTHVPDGHLAGNILIAPAAQSLRSRADPLLGVQVHNVGIARRNQPQETIRGETWPAALIVHQLLFAQVFVLPYDAVGLLVKTQHLAIV